MRRPGCRVAAGATGDGSDVHLDFYLQTLPDQKADEFRFDAELSDDSSSAEALADAIGSMARQILDRKDGLSQIDQPTIILRQQDGSHTVWQEGSSKHTQEVGSIDAAMRARDQRFHEASSGFLYESVRPYLLHLRDVLLPRLLQL